MGLTALFYLEQYTDESWEIAQAEHADDQNNKKKKTKTEKKTS